MTICIDEQKEERFFENHFDFGDDKETVLENLHCALKLYAKAFRRTCGFAEMAEDGEVFDSAEAARAFDLLALSYKYSLSFMKDYNKDLAFEVVENSEDDAQKYINQILSSLR